MSFSRDCVDEYVSIRPNAFRAHRTGAYLFDRDNREDWIAQHFFTGG
jgi:hypothetical protein